MLSKILNFFSKRKKTTSKKKYESIELIYTPVQNLRLGMYVAELDRPWLESPFLFQGFIIESEKDLQAVQDTCQYVYVDVNKQKKERGISISTSKHVENNEFMTGRPPERLGTFEQEIGRAEQHYHETGKIINAFMDDIVDGGGIDSTIAKEAVAECVNSVLHSPDAFLWLSQLKNKDEYTSQHSLNVCVLSIVLGRHINLSELQLNHVGLCGMMHDMGKMLVPLEILNKPGKLEADELEIMQSHTTLGYELLKSSRGMFYGAIETALTHHERMDGNGYPRKVNSSSLSYYSNIVAIADMYDAITSDRVYKKGETHYTATKIMLENSGTHLDAQLTVKFIESLGVYPPGCFVRISDGTIGLVVEVNMKFRLRPKIMTILNHDKEPVDEQVIDLAELPLDGSGEVLSIREIIDPAVYKIDSKKYYQEGIIQKGFSRKG